MNAPSGCVLFHGGKDSHGYGMVRIGAVKRGAHRVAYATHHGVNLEELDGVVVRHTCDTPACVNPAHLVLGTQAENMQDKKERGRAARVSGSTNGMARLTEADVIAIRTAFASGAKKTHLARQYGVSFMTIHPIVTRKTWTHI